VKDIERSVEGACRAATSRARGGAWLFALLASLSVACAGKNKPASHAHEREESSYYDESSPSSSHKSHESESDEQSGDKPSGKMTKVSNQDAAEPVFSEGMSVEEAIRAVPPGAERRNIDQETLGKPLQDLSLYESCKPGSARFKVRVAVWNGKAVGIDLSVAPKNDKLADCVKAKIREVTWEKKVKSLNTIEYQF
jgi:hypothetical protein